MCVYVCVSNVCMFVCMKRGETETERSLYRSCLTNYGRWEALGFAAASWRPKRTNGVSSRTKKSLVFSLDPKASEGMLQLKAVSMRSESQPFFFDSDLQLMVSGPPTLWKSISFAQPTHSNVNFIQKYLHRHTQNNIWPNTWVPCRPIMLTHKINWCR